MCFRFLVIFIVALVVTSSIQAHRLLVHCEVLPGRRIKVRTEFELGGGVALGAKLRAYIPPGQLIHEATLEEDGTAIFRFNQLAPIRVVVQDTIGHRAEEDIPTRKLRTSFQRSILSEAGLSLSPYNAALSRVALLAEMTSTDAHRHKIESNETDFKPPAEEMGLMLKVLIGVSFLLAVAAFFIALRNAREIERLKRERSA